jgi:hypothetical protein
MKCKIKNFLFVLFFFFHSYLLFSIEIYLAPLVTVTEDFTLQLTEKEQNFGELFYTTVMDLDPDQLLNIGLVKKNELIKDREIKSALDAQELCEIYKIDFLIYGFYKKSYKFIDAEIRIYDRERKEHRKIFYAKAEPDEYEKMKNELAQKLVQYLNELFGITQKASQKKTLRILGGIELQVGGGYWTPVGVWFDVMTGVFKADIGLFIQPETVLFSGRNWFLLFRYGISAEYNFGMNKPGLEDSYLHSGQLAIPIHLCALIFSQHLVYLGTSVYYKHDFIYQIRVFGDPVWEDSGSLGVAGMAGYEYWCGDEKSYAFGAEFKTGVDFYKNPDITMSLTFTFKYRFPFGKSELSEEGGK